MELRPINPLEVFLNQELGPRIEHQSGFFSERTHRSAGPRKADCVKIARKYNIDLGGNPENLGGHEISRMLQDAWARGKFPKPRDTSNEVKALREQNASMMERMERMEAMLAQPAEEIKYGPIKRERGMDIIGDETIEVHEELTPTVIDPTVSLPETVTGYLPAEVSWGAKTEEVKALSWKDLRKEAIRLGVQVSGGKNAGLVKRVVLEPLVIEALEKA